MKGRRNRLNRNSQASMSKMNTDLNSDRSESRIRFFRKNKRLDDYPQDESVSHVLIEEGKSRFEETENLLRTRNAIN